MQMDQILGRMAKQNCATKWRKPSGTMINTSAIATI
jgi:hypothetical protein